MDTPKTKFQVGHSAQPFHLLGFSSPQALQTPSTLPKEPKLTRTSHATSIPNNNFSENRREIKTEILDATELSDLQPKVINNFDREVNISSADKSLDILNCNSPTTESSQEQLDERSVDSGMLPFVSTVLQTPNEHMKNQHQKESVCSVMSENHQMDDPFNKQELGNSTETSQVSSAGHACAVLAEGVVHNLRTEISDKSCSHEMDTTIRRCFVSEMSGSHYRKLVADTSSSPAKSAANYSTSNDNSLKSTTNGSKKCSFALPGIDLHLNSLTAGPKDKITVRRKTLTCRRQLISSPSTAKPPTTKFVQDVAIKEESDGQKDGFLMSGNVSEKFILGEGIEFPQSYKKKRHKSDKLGETVTCMRCNCKKSKCIKLYCECFAAGLYCVEPCNCQNCFNKHIYEDIVLETRRQIESRNPLAFAPKVISSSDTLNSMDDISKTPASVRHKSGCNCKKSGCLKKYCQCFQSGVGCSLNCRCEACKNTFGCKEGYESIVYQETKFLQRNASDASSLDNVHGTDENHDQVTPELSKNARQPTFENHNGKIQVVEENASETMTGDYSMNPTIIKYHWGARKHRVVRIS